MIALRDGFNYGSEVLKDKMVVLKDKRRNLVTRYRRQLFHLAVIVVVSIFSICAVGLLAWLGLLLSVPMWLGVVLIFAVGVIDGMVFIKNRAHLLSQLRRQIQLLSDQITTLGQLRPARLAVQQSGMFSPRMLSLPPGLRRRSY